MGLGDYFRLGFGGAMRKHSVIDTAADDSKTAEASMHRRIRRRSVR